MLSILKQHGCLVLLALSSTAIGCWGGASPAPPEMPPPKVTVAKPVMRDLSDYREYTGRIKAVEMVEVRARVKGFLEKIHFIEGAEVKKGTLLYEIDPRTFQAELDRTKAEVTRLQVQLDQAESEAERAQRLRGTRAVSEEEYLQRASARNTARAALEQARASVKTFELELGFTKIYAPINGRIGRTLVTEGNLVGFSEPTLLTSIVRLDPVFIYFEETERGLLEHHELMSKIAPVKGVEAVVPVFVGLATETGFPHQGTLSFLDNKVDPGTATIVVRGKMANPDRKLTPGLFARVKVPVSEPRKRLLIPEQALAADQRGRYLFVVNNGNMVERRDITLGQALDGLIVIETGLKADERFIVDGLQRARPGAAVAPEEKGKSVAAAGG